MYSICQIFTVSVSPSHICPYCAGPYTSTYCAGPYINNLKVSIASPNAILLFQDGTNTRVHADHPAPLDAVALPHSISNLPNYHSFSHISTSPPPPSVQVHVLRLVWAADDRNDLDPETGLLDALFLQVHPPFHPTPSIRPPHPPHPQPADGYPNIRLLRYY